MGMNRVRSACCLFFSLVVSVFADEFPMYGSWWESATAEDVATLLSSGADVHQRNNDQYSSIMMTGATPLMFASRYNRFPELLRTLLEAGADVSGRSLTGHTALMHAISGGAPVEIVEMLIATGADVNAQEEVGWTPLMIAAWHPDPVRIIELLVTNGADPMRRDVRGSTAVAFFAGNSDSEAALEWLLEYEHAIDSLNEAWNRIQQNDALKGSTAYWRLNEARLERSMGESRDQ